MPMKLTELSSYLDSLRDPHIVFDLEYKILACNPAYEEVFGDGTPVIGRRCFEVSHHFVSPCNQCGEVCPVEQVRLSGKSERILHVHHTRTGEVHVGIELTPIKSSQGHVVAFVEKMETLPQPGRHMDDRGLVGRSPAFLRILEQVRQVASSRTSVLLLGESGTGKELIAKAIHEASGRSDQPLVIVDCATLVESLLESELFGHEKGAFTGALQVKRGLVEAADGGTLFLDEVGDLPLSMQVKLLRLLESGTYRRVGATEPRRADLRIVAATHRDLLGMVESGLFREDLYYRLATFPIVIPPLRERRVDIPALADVLLQRLDVGRHVTLDKAAVQRLVQDPFPGNIRELRNVLERATLLAKGAVLSAEVVAEALAVGRRYRPRPSGEEPTRKDAPAALVAKEPARVTRAADTSHSNSDCWNQPMTVKDRETAAIRDAWLKHEGSRGELARRLGLSERTLYRRLKSMGLIARSTGDQ